MPFLTFVIPRPAPLGPPSIYPAPTHWELSGFTTWTRGWAWRSNGGAAVPGAVPLVASGGNYIYHSGDWAGNPSYPPRTRPRDLLRAFFHGIAAPAAANAVTVYTGDGSISSPAPLLTHGGGYVTPTWQTVTALTNGWKARRQGTSMSWTLDSTVPQTQGVGNWGTGSEAPGAPYGAWNDGSGALSGAFTARFDAQWAWIAASVGDLSTVAPYSTNLLDGACGLGCPAYTGTWYLGLVRESTHSIEMSGSGYARVPVTWGAPVLVDGPIAGTQVWTCANAGALSWTWTANGTPLLWALYDAPTGGNRVAVTTDVARLDSTTTPAAAHLAAGELAVQIW